jgi:hypothetical protein
MSMVSEPCGDNDSNAGCLPALRKFSNMFELKAALLSLTDRGTGRAREASLLDDAKDDENNGIAISATRATKAAIRITELRFAR